MESRHFAIVFILLLDLIKECNYAILVTTLSPDVLSVYKWS